MATDTRSFHHVKALLGRLDRSIDEARSKRLRTDSPVSPSGTPKPEASPAAPGPLDTLVIGRSGGTSAATPAPETRGTAGGSNSGTGPSAATPVAAPPVRASPFGRARPLRSSLPGADGVLPRV